MLLDLKRERWRRQYLDSWEQTGPSRNRAREWVRPGSECVWASANFNKLKFSCCQFYSKTNNFHSSILSQFANASFLLVRNRVDTIPSVVRSKQILAAKSIIIVKMSQWLALIITFIHLVTGRWRKTKICNILNPHLSKKIKHKRSTVTIDLPFSWGFDWSRRNWRMELNTGRLLRKNRS